MPKTTDARLSSGTKVHAKSTVVFKSKQDCRRYVGADYHESYVNGTVVKVDYRQDKRGKQLAHPVIDFQYGGAEPKRAVLALLQVILGRCPGFPMDDHECFFKLVGADGMTQTRVDDIRKVTPEKRKELLMMAGQRLVFNYAKYICKLAPPSSQFKTAARALAELEDKTAIDAQFHCITMEKLQEKRKDTPCSVTFTQPDEYADGKITQTINV